MVQLDEMHIDFPIREPGEATWEDVKEKVIHCCGPTKDPGLMDLCLAIALYDYWGAPSNWDYYEDIYPHEQDICSIAKWAIEDNYDVRSIIKTYEEGDVPDCSDLVIEYI